jgi:flagellar motor switch protein FliN
MQKPTDSRPDLDDLSGSAMPAHFATLSDQSAADASPAFPLTALYHLPLTLTVELGRTRMSIAELLSLKSGAVLELDSNSGDPVNLYVNGCLVAKGEVIVLDDQFGIRLIDIFPIQERSSHRVR